MTTYAGGIEVERVSGNSWESGGTYQVTIPHDRRFIAEDVHALVEVHSTTPGASSIYVVHDRGRMWKQVGRSYTIHDTDGGWLVPVPVPTWVMLSAMAVAGQLMPETVWEGLAKDAMEARKP